MAPPSTTEPTATFDDLWQRTGLDGSDHEATATILGSQAPTASDTRPDLPLLSLGTAQSAPRSRAGLVVQELLGEGGMGVVHGARQPLLDRDVAIKRVRPDAPGRAARMLYREARMMGSLEHPNIIPVHTLGADEAGNPVLVMKRVEGVPWSTLIRDPDHPHWAHRLDRDDDAVARNVQVLVDVCRAVAYAHERGVLHRDLKPDNIMLGRQGEVYVLDWGIACRLDEPRPPGVVGTPAFLAPEMVDLAAPLSQATDVFLLGGCLHAVLTGRAPHQGGDLRAVVERASRAPRPRFRDDVPEGLADACRRALARDPADRFPSAEALQRALVLWLRTRGADAVARGAEAHLAEARDALAAGDEASAAARLSTARFGFEEALRLAPDARRARDGLHGALGLLLDHELARDNVVAAAGLLAELADAGADLTAYAERLARSRERVAATGQDAARWDLATGRYPRVYGFAVMTAIGVLMSVFAVVRDGAISAPMHLGAVTGIWVVALVAAATQWSRIADSANNARMAQNLIAVLGVIVVSSWVGWWNGDPPHLMLAGNLYITAAALASVAIFHHGWLMGLVPVCIAAAALATFVPSLAALAFGLALTVFAGASTAWWWRTARMLDRTA